MADPRILVLDEATSALDVETENRVNQMEVDIDRHFEFEEQQLFPRMTWSGDGSTLFYITVDDADATAAKAASPTK